MDELERRLERWVGAGIITPEQAAAIRGAERTAGRARSMAATALGYLGASVALVGGIVAAWREWSRMPTGARLALASAATLSLLVTGFIARRRRHPALRSLDTFLWFLSAGGAAFTAGLFAHDMLDLETRSISLWAGGAAAAWGTPLWRLNRGPLQEIAVFSGLAVFLEAVLAHLPGPPDLHGLPLWGLGAVWAVLGGGRVLPGPVTSIALGGAGLLLGAQILSFGWRAGGLALGIATAVAMLAASVALRSRALLGFGAAGVLLFLPQIVFEYLGDTLGAPLALLVTGIILLAGAFLTARLKGAVRGGDAGPGRTSAARARKRALLLAAIVAALVVGAIYAVGIAPLPDYVALQERPDPSIPGQVAFVRWRTGPCVFVVVASGGEPRRIRCSSDDKERSGEAAWLGGPVFWTEEGWLAVQAYDPVGNQVVVVDPRSGHVIERIAFEQPLVDHPQPDDRRADGARLLVNRSGRAATLGITPPDASPREVARVDGPPGYTFWQAEWSPDGEWILVRDSNEDLLVVRAREGAPLRLLAERVSGEFAWHIPGAPADIDLDSLRARR